MMNIKTFISFAFLAIAILATEVFASPTNYSVAHAATDTSEHESFTYTSPDGEILPWGRMAFNSTHGVGDSIVTAASVDDVDDGELAVAPRASLQKVSTVLESSGPCSRLLMTYSG